MANILQERYSALLDKKLRVGLVVTKGFNTRYEGNPKAGAVKIPVRDLEVEVKDYNRQSGIDLTFQDTGYESIFIGDNSKRSMGSYDVAINELIDGFEAAAVPDSMFADRIDSAGYKAGLTIETIGITAMKNAIEAAETTTPGCIVLAEQDETVIGDATNSAYTKLVKAQVHLSENKVPQMGRRYFVSPKFMGAVLDDNRFLGATEAGFNVKTSGVVRQILGSPVEMSNLLGNITLGTEDCEIEFIGYHSTWQHMVNEWHTPIELIDLKGSSKFVGASAIKGRKIGGFGFTKTPSTIVAKVVAPVAPTQTSTKQSPSK